MNVHLPRSPRGSGALALYLILASLSMLFVGAMLGYVVIRHQSVHAPPAGTLGLPWGLYVSTGLIVCSSLSMHAAVRAVMAERTARFRRAMLLTLALGLAFLAVQAPALVELLQTHHHARAEHLHLYGLVFVLVLLHAAHVVGGVLALAVVTLRAMRGRYDHEQFAPVRYTGIYWHFLDIVWVTMFIVLLLTR